MRPFGKNFRQDCGERAFEIRPRAVKNAVLQAVRVRQARELAPVLCARGLQQDRGCRGRPFIGVDADLGSRRHAAARHQGVPGRELKKTVQIGCKSVSEPARESAKIGIYVEWHRARTRSSGLLGRCKVQILSIAELLGEGIKRIHDNESVTSLFEINDGKTKV